MNKLYYSHISICGVYLLLLFVVIICISCFVCVTPSHSSWFNKKTKI